MGLTRRRVLCWSGLVSLLLLTACGSSSSGLSVPPGALPGDGTARLRVDLTSGAVTVTPLIPPGRAALTGTVVQIQAGPLTAVSGGDGQQQVGLTLVNRGDEPLGVRTALGQGLRVWVDDVQAGPALAGGSTVQLLNPSGRVGGMEGGRPYVDYPEALAVGASSQPRDWRWQVPAGLTAFWCTLTVSTDLPQPDELGASDWVSSPLVRIRTLAGRPGEAAVVDGPLGEARLAGARPAVDASGVVYLAERSGCVRRLGRDGRLTTIAGRAGQPGGIDGSGEMARFTEPLAIDCEPDGRVLYIADGAGQRVRRLALGLGANPAEAGGWQVTTIAGDGTAGHANGPGDQATFNRPAGLALAGPDRLYVSEYDGHRIRRLDRVGSRPDQAASWQVSLLAGDDRFTKGGYDYVVAAGAEARFYHPAGLDVGPDGAIYVADRSNHAIRRVRPDGWAEIWAGAPRDPELGYADGVGFRARFDLPTDLVVSPRGYVYVAERSPRLRRIDPGRRVSTVFRSDTGAPLRDGVGPRADVGTIAGLALAGPALLLASDASGTTLRQLEAIVSGSQ